MNINTYKQQQLFNTVKQFNNIKLMIGRTTLWALSNPVIQLLIH